MKTAGTDGRDGRDRTPRLSANAAANGSSDERLHASESLVATTDEWLRQEIAKRERALAELEAFRERYEGVATDQAALLETETAARKAAEKELAAQRDEVEALTKEFEQQLDKELAEYEKAQSELADQRDKFRDMASSYRGQFEQETEQRQKLEDELDTLKRKRATAAKSRKAPPKKASGTINAWLVLAVFALTFGAAWILTSAGTPFMSQLSELQYLAESIWASIDEPD